MDNVQYTQMTDYNTSPVFDMDKALNRVHGKQELLARVISIFKKNLQEKKQSIASELTAENWDNLKMISHSLKGSAWTIGAQRLGEIAYAMEKASAIEDISSFKHLLTILEASIDEINTYFEHHNY